MLTIHEEEITEATNHILTIQNKMSKPHQQQLFPLMKKKGGFSDLRWILKHLHMQQSREFDL